MTSQPYATHVSGARAGFWVRVGAVVLDGIIVSIIPVILIIIGAASGSDGFVVFAYVVWLLLAIGYDVYYHGGESGQTIGKRVVGIRVIDSRNGGPIGYGRSAVRFFGRYLSAVACYLGYLWMLWDKEKQCWHDKMANDLVVPVSDFPVVSRDSGGV
jgi:uncharacterized RDD family membrane protein YckC